MGRQIDCIAVLTHDVGYLRGSVPRTTGTGRSSTKLVTPLFCLAVLDACFGQSLDSGQSSLGNAEAFATPGDQSVQIIPPAALTGYRPRPAPGCRQEKAPMMRIEGRVPSRGAFSEPSR